MFRHHGDNRTHEHNVKIATLLSFIAGAVNVIGFISIQRLTTNVTGHFAFFVDDMFNLKFYEGFVFFLFVFSFFFGAFVSNTLIELVDKKGDRNIFIFPVALEISIIVIVAFTGYYLRENSPNIIAVMLLFSMGLQNSLVTKISNAVVRTTHLTGLFTDLGIEVSQLIFYTNKQQREKLFSNISLRMIIIIFFFTGGIIGGLLYSQIQFYALLVPAFLLLLGLVYDNLKFRLLKWKSG